MVSTVKGIKVLDDYFVGQCARPDRKSFLYDIAPGC